MYLTILDLVLTFIVFLLVSLGFVTGLVQAVGAVVGLGIGTWIAGRYYQQIAGWLTPIFLGNQTTANIVSFVLIFGVTNRLVGLIFWLIGKIFNLVSIIPFTKTINRLLGALFGLIEAVLGLGLVLYFINQSTSSEWIHGVIASSQVAGWLMWAGGILAPLLPKVAQQVQAVI